LLICPKCFKKQSETEALVNKNPLPSGGYHLIARCCQCNAFLKNLPHSEGSNKLYFGKHKGKFISEVAKTDYGYLEWLLSQDIKESLKQKIHEGLKKENARLLEVGLDIS